MKAGLRLLVTALLLALAWTAWQAGKILPMGGGYMAKAMCSEYFVAGRNEPDDIHRDLTDIHPLFGWSSYEIDEASGRAHARTAAGLLNTTAVYREGLGCTIAAGVPAAELAPLPGGPPARPARLFPLPGTPGKSPALEAVLDEAFREPSEDSHRRTRAVVVLKNGRLVAERYAPGFARHTPLIGWSMTKSVTNNLIGLLVGDGVLRLDQPAPVPEWQSEGDPRGTITLRHLLQMSSGLDFEEVYEPGSDATRMLFTEYSAAAYAAAAPLAHEPGSRWYYSSGTTNILARIFRDAAGGTVADAHAYIRNRLLEPLGIESMVIEFDASGSPVGSSFSYATARDWARMGQFWLQQGRWNGRPLLPEDWMRWSVTPAPAAERGQYGAQFWLNAGAEGAGRPYPDLPASMFYAHGYSGQIVAVFPEQRVVAVRLGFTTDGSWDDNAFLAAILDALRPAG